MRRFPSWLLAPALALAAFAAPAPALAQGELHGIKPGRDPQQAIDSAYTAKIREYTTEPFFSSPLVDYLPASRTVPTPMAELGDIAGARNNLPYSSQVYAYMRSLAKASPRVRVWTIGHTEEGREMIAVGVASEAIWNNLDQNKANLAKLADPRTIGMSDADGREAHPGDGARVLHHRHHPLTGDRARPRRSWSWPTAWPWTRAPTSRTSATT